MEPKWRGTAAGVGRAGIGRGWRWSQGRWDSRKVGGGGAKGPALQGHGAWRMGVSLAAMMN